MHCQPNIENIARAHSFLQFIYSSLFPSEHGGTVSCGMVFQNLICLVWRAEFFYHKERRKQTTIIVI